MSFTIKNTNDKKQMKLNVVVYGPFKVGKTSLAKTVDNCLVISIENGMLCLADAGIDYIDCPTFTSASSMIKTIKENKDGVFDKYEWIMIDQLTELAQNMYPPLRDQMTREAIANGSKGSDGRQVWTRFAEMIGGLVKEIRALDMHTCILAQSADREVEGIEKQTVDLYGKSGHRIIGWIDEVFYMHIDSDDNRKFLTSSTDRTIAGDRSGKLDKIEPADLGHIQKKILGLLSTL